MRACGTVKLLGSQLSGLGTDDGTDGRMAGGRQPQPSKDSGQIVEAVSSGSPSRSSPTGTLNASATIWSTEIRSTARTPPSTWDTQLSERPILVANSAWDRLSRLRW
jgi:hypothetical protein